MSKIRVTDNDMAMFMLCEAIGGEIEEYAEYVKPDENGFYEVVISINGKSVNTDRFIESLQRSYVEAVKRYASQLLSAQYDKIFQSVVEIQETLEHHNEIFDEKFMDNINKQPQNPTIQ